MNRQFSPIDSLLNELSAALNTLSTQAPPPNRPTPSEQTEEPSLTEAEKRHAAGLMRVNHSGEICAQALYKGQALTAKLPRVRKEMEQAAEEEQDHLAWCEDRVRELGSEPSKLNPLWYTLSFGLGASAGLISDKLSLGFVSAVEDQVCAHLDSHLESLPKQDGKSRAIVEKMREDEAHHSHAALQAGGLRFPTPIKKAMSLVSKAMTSTSYKI